MMENVNGLFPDIAIPPGDTIKEKLMDIGMTQAEFAKRMDLSEKHINRLLNGKEPLTQQTALKLESVLGLPARFWNNMESLYQENLARIKEIENIESDKQYLTMIPYTNLANIGFVKKTRDNFEKVIELRRFFEVSSLSCIKTIIPSVAFRKSEKTDTSPYSLAAWLKMCEIKSRDIEVGELDKKKLKSALPEIRRLTKETPDIFLPKLKEILSSCGIALVLIPNIPKAAVQGATQHINNKVILGLTIRYRFADIFWFSLFHEIGHILYHSKKDIFINLAKDRSRSEQEDEADEFAASTLIPPNEYNEFIKRRDFNGPSVVQFANKNDIHPCIVVGRLQKERYLGYNQLSSYKIRFEWAN